MTYDVHNVVAFEGGYDCSGGLRPKEYQFTVCTIYYYYVLMYCGLGNKSHYSLLTSSQCGDVLSRFIKRRFHRRKNKDENFPADCKQNEYPFLSLSAHRLSVVLFILLVRPDLCLIHLIVSWTRTPL